MWIITYVVAGDGIFPLDMLRYDTSYPDGTEDVIKVMARGHDAPRREVTLIARSTDPQWMPTRQRWHSFGWDVVSKAKARKV